MDRDSRSNDSGEHASTPSSAPASTTSSAGAQSSASSVATTSSETDGWGSGRHAIRKGYIVKVRDAIAGETIGSATVPIEGAFVVLEEDGTPAQLLSEADYRAHFSEF
jgi:hypothetical protein